MGFRYQSNYCEAEREEEYFNSSMGYNMGGYNSHHAGGFGNGFAADQMSGYSSSSYSSVDPCHSYGKGMGLGMGHHHSHHGGGGMASEFMHNSEQESYYASNKMGSGYNMGMGCNPCRKFL